MEVVFAHPKKIEKEIKAFNKKEQKKVFNALEQLENFPNVQHLKKISGSIGDIPQPCFRIRVDKFGILFTFNKDIRKLIVYKVIQRKNTY